MLAHEVFAASAAMSTICGYKADLKFRFHHIIFLVSKFLAVFIIIQCHGDHFWRITIQQQHRSIHIAEVHFFYKGQRLSRSIFAFTSSSYMSGIKMGGKVSGPPEAANDGDVNTFFHSAYDDQAGGYRGTCCPDPSPTLIITTHQNILFDRITIINRQDLDDSDNHFYDRLIGATITVHDRDNRIVLRSKVLSALSSYNFDMPKDKTSCLPGKGCFARTEDRDAWRALACPVETTTHNCYHLTGMADRAKKLDEVSLPFNVDEDAVPLLNLLSNRTVLFVGDSLMRQFWQALVCFFHSHLLMNDDPDLPIYDINWFLNNWAYDPESCPYGAEYCAIGDGCVTYWKNNFKLCLVHFYPVYSPGVIKKLTQVQNLQSTDIVIANLGIHYNFEEPSQLRKYENEVSLFVNELKEKTPTPKLLWMESSPQHFPGAENGYYEEQIKKKNMIDANRKPGSENNTSSNWCQPFGNYSLAHSEDHRNRLVERLRTGLPVIPLWQYLWNLSYAHLEQPKRKDSNVYDCTHWCAPGPYYQAVPHALLHALRSELPVV